MYQEIIKELRIDNDKTQEEIANILGVGQSYYSKQERHDKPFQIEHIIKLCISRLHSRTSQGPKMAKRKIKERGYPLSFWSK